MLMKRKALDALRISSRCRRPVRRLSRGAPSLWQSFMFGELALSWDVKHSSPLSPPLILWSLAMFKLACRRQFASALRGAQVRPNIAHISGIKG